ncbi:MAG: AMP nucleosidase [Pseudomonadota bacterium]|uniref:AMP nucleosidase n=1 Tax=Rhizorhabdus phycosphaerae TaxID=2711156 RepID=UPI0013EAA908|nr:AMP nucleosidase [Rhizorhabdus phycosphaerae]
MPSQGRDIVEQLDTIYRQSVSRLRAALTHYIRTGERPDPALRANGSFAYPEVRLHYEGGRDPGPLGRSFGRLQEAGDYAVAVTQPALFGHYLEQQIDLLIADYGVEVEAGLSSTEIPYNYVLDAGDDLDLTGASPVELSHIFPSTELAQIGDELADGLWLQDGDSARPLALFDAPRVDFSLARLRHYTGTPPSHVQDYILFTNYHRYVDEFVQWAIEQLNKDDRYTMLSGAGGVEIRRGDPDPRAAIADSAWRKHQMPAYHLVAPDGSGITLVNIGVGPSNAKTITDHLAVMRPAAWLMIGHCGGLRPSQRIGDYVLAHAYLRDDHVLDAVLPPEIPIPAIAEVQQALTRAAEIVSGQSMEQLKLRMRTGTVVTSDDRNWELRYTASALRFSQSRAVAIDMESATLAAQGYRFRVPYGTLLCVSDKPIHGEIKLPGQANRFYERAIAEHLQIGIAAVDQLRGEGARLHSRKLRAFNEPPFR